MPSTCLLPFRSTPTALITWCEPKRCPSMYSTSRSASFQRRSRSCRNCSAAFNRLPAHAAARNACGLRHYRQHFRIFAGGYAPQQRSHHPLRGRTVLLQGLVRGHAYFTRLFVTKSRTFYRELPVRQADAPLLRSVPPNVAATLARRARPSNLLSTQIQDRFDRLPTDAVDHFINGHPGLGDQFHQRQQNLSVRFRELFHAGGCILSLPAHNMVRFLHGGGVLSKIGFGESILTNRLPPPPLNLQLSPGHPPLLADPTRQKAEDVYAP